MIEGVKEAWLLNTAGREGSQENRNVKHVIGGK
jgi:hypothetical protein